LAEKGPQRDWLFWASFDWSSFALLLAASQLLALSCSSLRSRINIVSLRSTHVCYISVRSAHCAYSLRSLIARSLFASLICSLLLRCAAPCLVSLDCVARHFVPIPCLVYAHSIIAALIYRSLSTHMFAALSYSYVLCSHTLSLRSIVCSYSYLAALDCVYLV
jgi:hypothetical protein